MEGRRDRYPHARRRDVKEATIWAATHEIWLGMEGDDAMSTTDPHLKALPRSEEDEAEEDTLGAEPFGGDLRFLAVKCGPSSLLMTTNPPILSA